MAKRFQRITFLSFGWAMVLRAQERYLALTERAGVLALKELSEQNAITAPRITAFPYFAMPVDGDKKLPSISSADDARKRVRYLKRIGADGN